MRSLHSRLGFRLREPRYNCTVLSSYGGNPVLVKIDIPMFYHTTLVSDVSSGRAEAVRKAVCTADSSQRIRKKCSAQNPTEPTTFCQAA